MAMVPQHYCIESLYAPTPISLIFYLFSSRTFIALLLFFLFRTIIFHFVLLFMASDLWCLSVICMLLCCPCYWLAVISCASAL